MSSTPHPPPKKTHEKGRNRKDWPKKQKGSDKDAPQSYHSDLEKYPSPQTIATGCCLFIWAIRDPAAWQQNSALKTMKHWNLWNRMEQTITVSCRQSHVLRIKGQFQNKHLGLVQRWWGEARKQKENAEMEKNKQTLHRLHLDRRILLLWRDAALDRCPLKQIGITFS